MSNSVSFLGIISIESEYISSSWRYIDNLSANTFPCARTESKSGRSNIGSFSIQKVAIVDRTLLAVRGIPIKIHDPNVTTDINVLASHKTNDKIASNLRNFHSQSYSFFLKAYIN